MGKRGSSHAEQNHGSMDHYLCPGILDPEAQICDLISRQGELNGKKSN